MTSDDVGRPQDQAEDRAARAKARRATRKAERAARPVPSPHPAFDALSLHDLRALRNRLQVEETHVSYWRRIIQGRLDLVRSASPVGEPVVDLRRVLSDAQRSLGRGAFADVAVGDAEPLSADLTEVWSRQVAPDDEEGRARLETDLAGAESELSAHRRDLHRRIDLVTDELIARYRQQPLLALDALWTDRDE